MSILKDLADRAYNTFYNVDEAKAYLEDFEYKWKYNNEFDETRYESMKRCLEEAMKEAELIEDVLKRLNNIFEGLLR